MPGPLTLHSTISSHRVVIVGNDAVLAALPARPVQLAHACLRAGFDVAVPGSWGDELLAENAIRALGKRGRNPAILCACPLVTRRMLSTGGDMASFCLPMVPPPVAVARYVRAAYRTQAVHITYVGACPGARDPLIDSVLLPELFLELLAQRGIVTSTEPLVFDSVVPPDRRRNVSLPGGCPSAESLWAQCDGRGLVEVDSDDVAADVAQRLISREHVLIDMATRLGCACSGMSSRVAHHSARVAVMSLEPPRSAVPILDSSIEVSVDAPFPHRASSAVAGPRASAPVPAVDTSAQAPAVATLAGRAATASAMTERVAPGAGVEQRDRAPSLAPADGRKPPLLPTFVRPFAEPDAAANVSFSATLASEDAAPNEVGGSAPPSAPSDSDGTSRRRHTPQAFSRHNSGAFPMTRTNSGEGPALPRAYVARRRAAARADTIDQVTASANTPTERELRIDLSVEPAAPPDRPADLRIEEDSRFFADRSPLTPNERRVVLAADAPPAEYELDEFDELEGDPPSPPDPATMRAYAEASALVREASRMAAEAARDGVHDAASEPVRVRTATARLKQGADGPSSTVLLALAVAVILLAIFVAASVPR